MFALDRQVAFQDNKLAGNPSMLHRSNWLDLCVGLMIWVSNDLLTLYFNSLIYGYTQ